MKDIPIYLIDGNATSSEILADYFSLKGHKVACFSTLDEFLYSMQPGRRGCVIMDDHLGGIGVEELQDRLISNNITMPTIFLVSAIGVSSVVRIMKRGAHYLMLKPLDMHTLFEQVREALKHQVNRRKQEHQHDILHRRISRLTDRERTILTLAMAGKQNKEIAKVLSISHRTVEAHRSHILAKTGVANMLELMGAVIEIERAIQNPMREPW